MLDIEGLRRTLVEMLEDTREFGKRIPKKPVAQAYVNAKLEVLERLVTFVTLSQKEGTLDMEKLKTEIKAGEKFKLSEMRINPRGGRIDPKLKEIADSLTEVDDARPVEGISWANFCGRVYTLVNKKVLPEYIKPKKWDGKNLLVHVSDDEVQADKERRARRQTEKELH